MRHGIGNLIEGFFNIARNGKDIAGVAETHLLSQINSPFVVVGCVECGNAPNPLGTKARSRAISAATVKGNTYDGRVVVAHFSHVFHVLGLHEGIDTGKMGKFAARKGGNGLVLDTGCAR
jgi:hypothetical protein